MKTEAVWSDASIDQGIPSVAGKHRRLGEAKTLSEPPEGGSPADILTLNFWPPDWETVHFWFPHLQWERKRRHKPSP